jgi:hypothetical protein
MERTAMAESKIDNHLVMVELVGPRFGRPAHDAAATLPFQRDEIDTEKVLRVAPIDDETVPYTPVEIETFGIQPSEPYALLHVELPRVEEIRVPIALDARINLVAGDHTFVPRPGRARTTTLTPVVAPRSRATEITITIAFLLGALAVGIGLPFLIAAFAR